MKSMRMYFDGGAAPNPGKAHICVKLGDEIHFSYVGYGTNNYAEWMALCWGMLIAHTQGIKELDITGDSQLIINQAKGNWRVKKEELKPFKEEYDSLLKLFTRVTLNYEPRGKNLAGHHIEQVLANR
jgi:ribonuclease HI